MALRAWGAVNLTVRAQETAGADVAIDVGARAIVAMILNDNVAAAECETYAFAADHQTLANIVRHIVATARAERAIHFATHRTGALPFRGRHIFVSEWYGHAVIERAMFALDRAIHE